MSRKCAYCGRTEKLTREHVIPKSIYEACLKDPSSYRSDIDKHFKGDQTIKDVCKKCNNEELSRLDKYFLKEYKKHLERDMKPGDEINFEYNYNKLSRFLLKTSYNQARTTKNDEYIDAHKGLIGYIMGEIEYVPDLKIMLLVVTGSKIENNEDERKYVYPKFIRCMNLKSGSSLNRRFLTSIVWINNFKFLIIYPIRKISKEKYNSFIGDLRSHKGHIGVELKKEKESIKIKKGDTTYFYPGMVPGVINRLGKRRNVKLSQKDLSG